jgi:hypothetical protein
MIEALLYGRRNKPAVRLYLRYHHILREPRYCYVQIFELHEKRTHYPFVPMNPYLNLCVQRYVGIFLGQIICFYQYMDTYVFSCS